LPAPNDDVPVAANNLRVALSTGQLSGWLRDVRKFRSGQTDGLSVAVCDCARCVRMAPSIYGPPGPPGACRAMIQSQTPAHGGCFPPWPAAIMP